MNKVFYYRDGNADFSLIDSSVNLLTQCDWLVIVAESYQISWLNQRHCFDAILKYDDFDGHIWIEHWQQGLGAGLINNPDFGADLACGKHRSIPGQCLWQTGFRNPLTSTRCDIFCQVVGKHAGNILHLRA